MRPSVIGAVLLTAAIIAVPFGYAKFRDRQARNFRVVQEGVLYRSGQLNPAGLGRAVHDHGFRTVIAFRHKDDPETGEPFDSWEGPFLAKLGVNFVQLPAQVWSPKEGVIPAAENVRKFNEIMADPKNHPVLIHCFAGVHRTGIHSAIYRMEFQGWSNTDAIAEMKALGYDNIDREDDVREYLQRYTPKRPRP